MLPMPAQFAMFAQLIRAQQEFLKIKNRCACSFWIAVELRSNARPNTHNTAVAGTANS